MTPGYTRYAPTAPAPEASEQATISFSQPGSKGSMSLFRKRRRSPDAAPAPWLFPSEKETFFRFSTTFTGNGMLRDFANAAEPSVEPLSTTTTSKPPG